VQDCFHTQLNDKLFREDGQDTRNIISAKSESDFAPNSCKNIVKTRLIAPWLWDVFHPSIHFLMTNVADPYYFDTDPDPTFLFDTTSNPT
jgi:hypothetical protein